MGFVAPVVSALGAMSTAAKVGLAIGAVGTAAQIQGQRKAARAQEQSFRAEQRRAEVQNIRSVRQQIRQARLAQSQMTNVAAQTGGMGSSGLLGGTSSVGSQLADNLGYMSNIAAENTAISNAQISSARATSNAAVFGAIGQLGGTIFGDMYRPTPSASSQGVSYASPSNAQMGNF
jgi:type II secretory pathway pseudopilin PulG